jgi:hypothetical protein
LIALVLVAACATTPPPPPERVEGCWIYRAEDGSAVTMRWLPDRTRPGVLIGSKHAYGAGGGDERYTLEPRNAGWALCSLDTAETRCWEVAMGEGGSLEGGRAFIDAYGQRLRISIAGDGPNRVIFQGARDGCD